MSRANLGIAGMYNSGLTPGLLVGSGHRHHHHHMKGRGFFDFVKKAHSFVKDNQLISKAKTLADAVGATAYLDEKTGGQFSNVADLAASKGYGRRRRAYGSKTMVKRKRRATTAGRKRKTMTGGRRRIRRY